MSYSNVIITERGKAYNRELLIKNKPLVFTKIATSIEKHVIEDIKELTELKEVKQTSPIKHHERIDEDTVEVRGLFSNEALSGAYHIQSIGIYVQGEEILPEKEYEYELDENGELVLDETGSPIEVEAEPKPVYELDESGNQILDEEGNPIEIVAEPVYEEVLYGVAVSEEPFYMASNHANQISLNLKLKVVIGEMENIELNVSPAGTLTRADYKDLDEKIKQVETDIELETALSLDELTHSIIGLDERQSNKQAQSNAELLEIMMSMMMGG